MGFGVPLNQDHRADLRQRFRAVRARSLAIAAPLSAEDMGAQAMEDASPAKWHLAHTTWFFAEFVLAGRVATGAPSAWRYLFNSYYEAIGPRIARPSRGLITRPPVAEVLDWRRRIDDALDDLLDQAGGAAFAELAPLVELGLNHEEQHQELMLTDILALFAAHPDTPTYRDDLAPLSEDKRSDRQWLSRQGGLTETGAEASGFAFDCERPRHRVWLEPFALADRLVTNAEWLEFIEDGGYANPLLWLSEGWACVKREGWSAPGYWRFVDDAWRQVTLAGLAPLTPAAPVSHVSYWEADAYARWAGARLPREAEWEAVAAAESVRGNLLGADRLRPTPRGETAQFFGDVWEWTQSAFSPYPGFRPAQGAFGEYNGKFMAAQFVLRGGSCLTPEAHIRASYRNFFYPQQRWQMMGLRLAKDLS
ncbi:MAG TPA: ergothioneine biosynthesis protein EgtB [Caulobacterales bacterium]|nr:ergothioneine biosynthesis protein EgtB [Caulobacterales bacterium]